MDEQYLKNVKRFYRVDRAIEMVLRVFSFVAAVCVVAMALIATANVIAQKIFHSNVPSANDYVTYLFVTIIYVALPHVQMETNLTNVDILSSKFNKGVSLAVCILSDIVGVVVFAFISKILFENVFLKYLSTNKVATIGATGTFVLWPFALLMVVSCAFMAFTFVWNNVRRIVYRGTKLIPDELCERIGVKPPMRFGPQQSDSKGGSQ